VARLETQLVVILETQPYLVRQARLNWHGYADFNRITLILDHLKGREALRNFSKYVSCDGLGIERTHARSVYNDEAHYRSYLVGLPFASYFRTEDSRFLLSRFARASE